MGELVAATSEDGTSARLRDSLDTYKDLSEALAPDGKLPAVPLYNKCKVLVTAAVMPVVYHVGKAVGLYGSAKLLCDRSLGSMYKCHTDDPADRDYSSPWTYLKTELERTRVGIMLHSGEARTLATVLSTVDVTIPAAVTDNVKALMPMCNAMFTALLQRDAPAEVQKCVKNITDAYARAKCDRIRELASTAPVNLAELKTLGTAVETQDLHNAAQDYDTLVTHMTAFAAQINWDHTPVLPEPPAAGKPDILALSNDIMAILKAAVKLTKTPSTKKGETRALLCKQGLTEIDESGLSPPAPLLALLTQGAAGLEEGAAAPPVERCLFATLVAASGQAVDASVAPVPEANDGAAPQAAASLPDAVGAAASHANFAQPGTEVASAPPADTATGAAKRDSPLKVPDSWGAPQVVTPAV